MKWTTETPGKDIAIWNCSIPVIASTSPPNFMLDTSSP
uniref:Uncharacterized protein n=1 Tax=Arundo donax TaxID=35708 RepID=A0A0A9E6S4_ARUDO